MTEEDPEETAATLRQDALNIHGPDEWYEEEAEEAAGIPSQGIDLGFEGFNTAKVPCLSLKPLSLKPHCVVQLCQNVGVHHDCVLGCSKQEMCVFDGSREIKGQGQAAS